MDWLYWTATAVSICVSFWLGKRVGANGVVLEVIKQRDQYWHKNFVQPWIKKYNRVLQSVLLASTENYCDSNKRNVVLTAENERLRRKAIRLAVKYTYFRKKYEEKPVDDVFNKMSSAIVCIAKHMK